MANLINDYVILIDYLCICCVQSITYLHLHLINHLYYSNYSRHLPQPTKTTQLLYKRQPKPIHKSHQHLL